MKINLTTDKILKINGEPVAFVAQEHLGLGLESKQYDLMYHLKHFKTKKAIMSFESLAEFRKIYKKMDWKEILKLKHA